MARKLLQSSKGVEVYVCKTLYQYLKKVTDLPNEKLGNWRNINNLLEDAGYKTKTQSSVKSKFNPSLPLEPLVKIVNLGFENHNTLSIDINVRLALPTESESQEMEDMGKVDRT